MTAGQRVRVVDGISKGMVGSVLRQAEPSPPPLSLPFWRVALDGVRERDIREDFLEPISEGT